MRAPYRVALLGFNAFERNILASHLRLAARRSPSYELHKILAEADYEAVSRNPRGIEAYMGSGHA